MSNNKFKELFLKDSVDKQLNIVFDGGKITNSELHSNQFELTESICSNTELRFGGCEASVIKFKVSNMFSSLKGKELDISIIIAGNTTDPYKLGKFKVESDTPTADRVFKDIVAYDRMYEIINTDVAEWYNSLTFPMSLKEFRTSFVSYFGLEQVDVVLANDDMAIEKTIETVELSGKAVAMAICEINGCFGRINRNGKFEYVILPEIKFIYPQNTLFPSNDLYPLGGLNDGTAISKNHYISCQYEDFKTHKIDGIDVWEDGESIGNVLNDGENVYVIQDNFLIYGKSTEELREILANLLNVISVIQYTPANILAIGNPAIDLGEPIQLSTKYKKINTYVLSRTISGIQSLKDNYFATGVEYYEKILNTTKNEILKLKSKTNKITRSIEETVSKIEDVENELSTEIRQTSEGLTVKIDSSNAKAEDAMSKAENALESVGDAAKYATNYLDLSLKGLIVGNMADEELEKNVLIGSDAVSIRDGDTVLADYSSDKIRLGLNSVSSIIELCGGIANMKYHAPDNYEYIFDISSVEPITLSSKKSAQFYSKIENDNETILSGIISRVVSGVGATLTLESSYYTSDGNTSHQSSISLGSNWMSIFGGSVGAYFNLNTDFLDIIGNVKATGGLYVGDNLHMWTDDEGGNIELRSPNDVLWQMDAHDNNLRLYTFGTDGVYRSPFSIGYSDGDVDFWQNIGVWGDLYAQKGFCLNGNWQTDTVVAQGDSGIWWYRKWASGFAECWCSKAVSATGNGYSMSALSAPVNTAFPFPFMSTPLLTYNSIGQSNVNHLVGNISYDQNMVYSVTLHPAAANNATFSGNLIIHAFGKWK